jgi:hypothetical protein
MPLARKTFLWIFGLSLGIGFLVGLIELVAPDRASVTLNNQDVTGVAGFLTASAIGGVVGLILGLVAGGVVKLATRNTRKAANP